MRPERDDSRGAIYSPFTVAGNGSISLASRRVRDVCQAADNPLIADVGSDVSQRALCVACVVEARIPEAIGVEVAAQPIEVPQ